MLIKLINLKNIINMSYLSEIKKFTYNYARKNGYKLLNKKNIIKLSIDNIKYIVTINDLIINETNLLKALIYYLQTYGDNKDIQLVIRKLNSDEIKHNSLTPTEKKIYDKIISEKRVKSFTNIKNIPLLYGMNEELKEIIYRIYTKKILIIEDEEKKEINKFDKQCIKECITQLLNENDIKMTIIGLLMMIKLNIDVDIPAIGKILSKLLNCYNDTTEYDAKKPIILCLTLFINEKRIETISDMCGNEVLYELLNYKEYLKNEQFKQINKYVHPLTENDKENKKIRKIVNNNIYKEIKKKLTYFTYPNDSYELLVGKYVSIKPKCDGQDCIFYQLTKLPLGLEINENTGEIYGMVSYEFNNDFIIKCENREVSLLYTIHLYSKIDLQFLDNKYKNTNLEIINNGKTLMNIKKSGFCHCFLNLKMEIGVHHIQYKFNESMFNNMVFGLINHKENYCAFGASTQPFCQNVFDENENQICLYEISGKISRLYGRNGSQISTLSKVLKNGDLIECIFNMLNKTFSININNEEKLLFNRISSPLYPLVIIYDKNNSVDIIDYWRE